MTITSSCKKMMAFVMAIALVLSVLFIPAQKEAKANTGSPSVKVLGATLRLDDGDNNGKQAMRIGIQVDNANQAYACAIQLTVGSKTYTVATKDGKGDVTQEKLHSKDVPGNSVIYAVVLKNIPESAFFSTISILGKAWDINDNLFTSDVAEKNVVGVVNTIQDKFPGLNICILNGSLYKNAGAAKLTAADLAGYSDDPDPEMTSNPLATPAPTRVPVGPDEWEVPFERFEETGEGEIFYSGGNDHDICAHVYDSYTGDLLCTNETGTQYVDGLVVNLPASEVAKNYRHVTVKYEYLSDSGRFGYKYRDTEGTEYFTFADFSRDGNTTEINIDAACVPVSKFFIITYDTGVSIRLKSIVFSNPVGLPTPTPTAAPTATPAPTAVPNANFFAAQVPSGSSITVDGAVDAAWANAIEYPFLYYSNGRVRNSSEATIKLLWDEDYIYGLYDVYDAFIDEGNNDEWNRDGIEIFFDENNSKESAYGGDSDANTDAFQYRVSGLATDVTAPAKNGFSHNTSATATLYDGLTSRVKTASNGCGYRVEFAIPVAQKNNLNRVVGFDATVMDAQGGTRNNEMWFTSQKTGSMYGDASLFENVQLIAAKPATPVNSPDPAQPADLLAHFTFDNSSRDGYVYRSTDGNAKATVIGSIDSVSTDAISGESLYKAKGNPSYLKLQNADGSSMLDGKDNVTISYWSYVPDAYDSNAINYGWGFYAGRNGISLETNNRYYLAMIDRDSKYRLDMAKSGGGGNNVDNIAKNSGAWNNVTVVVKDNGDDTATSTVYVNGVQQATINGLTLSEALGTNSKFFIGIRPWAAGDGAEYFQGYIDDFAVFDRAFTASEVASYVGAVAVPTPAPTATPTPTPEPTPPVTDTELDPDNLVTNGNLANGTTGWSTNYANGISNQVVDYTHVLQVASRWNSYSGPKTTITGTFLPGDVLTYEFKIKRSMTLDNYTRYFVLKFSEAGTEHESRPSSSSDGAGNAVGDADHWLTYYGSYTVQQATNSIDVICMESGYVAYSDDNPSSNYTFYIDDVQIVKTYAAPTPEPTPEPSPTPEAAAWNDNYETQAKYELWTPSGTDDRGMLGKEVIFVALADNNKVYAMSANGDTITKADISDMYFGDTLYIPTNYNLYNISWSTMWNKAESTTTPDMGKGYIFQNMEDETYLGIWGVELSSQGMPTSSDAGITLKRRFTWSPTLYANYKTGNFIHFDGTDFDADASTSNVLCYVKSYTGDHAVKNTWHQVDRFTTGRDYLLVTSNTPGTARAFYMTGTANNSYDGKDVTINADGTITYSAAFDDTAVVNAHSFADGTFVLDNWSCPTVRHTLSYNGNGSDQSLYITSDNMLKTYCFRFDYSIGALKAYYGSSGKDKYMAVKWRTRSSGQLGIGNGSSNTNEFFIFERDITPQDYSKSYAKISDLSQIQDGDKVLMIYNGGSEFMLPQSIEVSNSSNAIRVGYRLKSTNGLSLDNSITGDFEKYEWTFTKSGSNWLIGKGGNNMKYQQVENKGYPATLDSNGDSIVIGGNADAYTFSNGTYVLNYNNRGVISGYTGSEATFTLYRCID